MPALALTSYNGDSKIFTISMVKDGAAFSPDPTTGYLVFTVKENRSDADEDSVYQKASSGAGITFSGSTASVRQLRADTLDLFDDVEDVTVPLDFFVELLWVDTETLLGEPVAAGGLRLTYRLTQEQTTSTDVITTEEPLPIGGADIPAWALPDVLAEISIDEDAEQLCIELPNGKIFRFNGILSSE
jgi:hypothetical protein